MFTHPWISGETFGIKVYGKLAINMVLSRYPFVMPIPLFTAKTKGIQASNNLYPLYVTPAGFITIEGFPLFMGVLQLPSLSLGKHLDYYYRFFCSRCSLSAVPMGNG